MKSNDLQVKAKQSAKRAGRGIAAGRGKTAGRGTKGQNARSGGKRRPGFEGGQNPLYMRLPKLKGFTSKRTPAHEVTTMQLENMGAKNIDHEALVKASVLSDKHTKVKIIVKGELSKALNVTLDGASAGAIKAIEKAGGSFKEQAAPKRPKKSAQPNDK